MRIYIGEWGSLRVTHVPTPETGNGSNMGFLERFWEWFRLLVRARTPRSGSTNVQSEKYRCFIWAIWNRRSLVGFTESQGFINSVSGAASNELICQEKFMSSLMLTYVKKCCFFSLTDTPLTSASFLSLSSCRTRIFSIRAVFSIRLRSVRVF